MSNKLHSLKNDSILRKSRKRVGRGIGSGLGKTSGRGEKGAGSRSGYTSRAGYEGGQFRLFMKLPIRGFSNARFSRRYSTINLQQVDQLYKDGEIVSENTLRERGYLSGKVHGIKLLGNGELTKNVSFEIDQISASAKAKLQKAKIPYTLRA